MNREDIISMAQEAQMPFYWRTGEITYLDKLERFAALVARAERKEWETEFAGMGEWACVYLLKERNK